MSSSLRRQLREALPASIKGLQRAVALEIADDARYDDGWRYSPESGRRSKARLADLVRWTGAKDELSVREMLRRLAVAGWEFRLPIGEGKDGRPLYAVPGQAMQFRVPDFKAPTVVGPSVEEGVEGPTVVGPTETEGPTVVGEGPTTVGEGPTVVAEDPTSVGPPSPVLLSSSRKDPSSSVAEVSPSDDPGEGSGGGGGGVSPSTDLAIEIAAALTVGQPVHRQLLETLTARLAAALDAGWSVDGLAVYLHMGEGFSGSVAAVAAWRLDPARLPAAEPSPGPQRAAGGIRGPLPSTEDYAAMTVDSVFGTGRDTADGGMWERAMQRANQRMGAGPLPGTDTTVAGWGAVARQLRTEHKPYSNEVWSQPADAIEAAGVPHCGDWDCDPVSRLRDVDEGNGLKSSTLCPKCHPKMRF